MTVWLAIAGLPAVAVDEYWLANLEPDDVRVEMVADAFADWDALDTCAPLLPVPDFAGFTEMAPDTRVAEDGLSVIAFDEPRISEGQLGTTCCNTLTEVDTTFVEDLPYEAGAFEWEAACDDATYFAGLVRSFLVHYVAWWGTLEADEFVLRHELANDLCAPALSPADAEILEVLMPPEVELRCLGAPLEDSSGPLGGATATARLPRERRLAVPPRSVRLVVR